MMTDFQRAFAGISDQYKSGDHVRDFEALLARLVGKTVVLFGAAWIGDFFFHRLESSGIHVTCFADNYAVGITPAGHGPIIGPAELKEKYPDAMVIISCDKARNIIYRQLLDLGFDPEQVIQYPKQLLATMDMEEFERYRDGYERAYRAYTDDVSRNIILSRIRCTLFGTPMEASEGPQYFEREILKLTDDEVFVDGGFFTGDTTEELLRQTNGNYRHIYGFEPDRYCIQGASDRIRNSPRIDIIEKGLYREEAKLRFATTGGTSSASGGNMVSDEAENVILVPVTSLDSFFDGKRDGDYPTFIKLDIEGSERDALWGMGNVIARARPKLAICAYHRPEDLYTLRELIQEFRSDYRFYLRHYTNYIWETVLYAV